jgi:hypothetical protein
MRKNGKVVNARDHIVESYSKIATEFEQPKVK